MTNRAYFSDLANILIGYIGKARYVYGCVAWLTHPDIISALRQKQCLIIVNKEDWEEPGRVRSFEAYGSLRPMDAKRLDLRLESSDSAIRCLDRLHHKFLILEREDGVRAVWSGSFNLTQNACNSLENAMFMREDHIIDAYLQEFIRLYRVSEKLSDTDWVMVAPGPVPAAAQVQEPSIWTALTKIVIAVAEAIPPTCHRCGKTGHTADRCWSRRYR